jgi:hypothetical protein
MHRGFKRKLCAALGGAICWLAAAAAVQADVTTTVSGFGTVGGTFTSNSNYAFHHDASEFSGASNDFDIGLESRLGLQVRIDFGSGLSVTAQEVFRERESTSFDPGTEWFYAQYSPNSDWQIRLGRVVMAAFLYSDSRQVGYAMPWFRAPNEMYGALPFDYLDGGQVLWQKSLGQFTLSAEASYGTTSGLFALSATDVQTTNAHDVFNAAVSVEYQSLLLRVARTQLSSPTVLPLTPTFSLDYEGHDYFTAVGVQYDDGKALVIGEWSRTQQNEAPILNEPLSGSNQWYLAGGWHFGKFLPLVMYTKFNEQKSLVVPDQVTFGTWSAMLRYDVVTNVALKAEISRPQASNGAWWVSGSNPDPNARVNVYSVGADFVF